MARRLAADSSRRHAMTALTIAGRYAAGMPRSTDADAMDFDGLKELLAGKRTGDV